MGGSVLANMSSLYSHVAWHMHIQSRFKWTQTINNKQVLQCPLKQFSTQNSHLRSFSWKFFQSSVRSCAATPGVLLASLRTGEILGEKVHLPRGCEPGFPGCQVHFSIVAAILLAALGVNQRDHILYTCARTHMASWVFQPWSEATSDIAPNSFLREPVEDWDNISKKAFCVFAFQIIKDTAIDSDVFWCFGIFKWNFWMADALIEGLKRFALLSGIVLGRCVFLARCPCMKAPNSTSPVSVHSLEFWILSPRTFI